MDRERAFDDAVRPKRGRQTAVETNVPRQKEGPREEKRRTLFSRRGGKETRKQRRSSTTVGNRVRSKRQRQKVLVTRQGTIAQQLNSDEQ